MTAHLEILVDGQPALTARMAVDRYRQQYGLGERAVRSAVARSGIPPITPHPLSARIPLCDQEALDQAMANRPRPRSRKEGQP